MGVVSIIGIDLAQRAFQLHGAGADGAVVFRRNLSRDRLLPFLAEQPRVIVAMEACASAHYWGREILAFGHEVRLVATDLRQTVRQAAARPEEQVVCGVPCDDSFRSNHGSVSLTAGNRGVIQWFKGSALDLSGAMEVGGIERLAGAISADLMSRFPGQRPGQRKTQWGKLALRVATMLEVRSANLMDLAASLPRPSERLDMRYQWIKRLLANALVDSDEVMAPFARDLLDALAGVLSAGGSAGGR